jgi:hypothetical protein
VGPREVTLADPRGCAAADFYVVPDGRISVRVVDAQQRPIRDTVIEVIDGDAVKPGTPLYRTSHIRTDSSGRIEWPQLRLRRYAIAVNALSDASATTDREGRFTLVLHAGVRYELLIFLNVTPSELPNATAPVPAEGSTSELRILLKTR